MMGERLITLSQLIQVCWNIEDGKTRKREIRALKEP